MMNQFQTRSSERGYSLVEVIVATGLLASVLLTIVSLFYMGQRNVYSGKQMTQAVSLATRVSEDLSALGYNDIYSAFGITDATALGTVDVDATAALMDDTYINSILRTTNDITAGTDPSNFLTRWRDEMINNFRFQDGSVTLIISPRSAEPPAAALTAGTASVMRIRILVRWREATRPRQVVLDSTRTRRPLPP